jgi:hypothetical protein
LGYDGFAFLEGSSDRSSHYQKKTTDLIISIWEFSFLTLIDAPWLSFGKVEQITLKLVAQDPYNVFNTFNIDH